MREALFIKKNRDKWIKAQQSPSPKADELANDFTEIVNDLAYAKTFYPTSKVTQFLNGQASKIYLSIYKNRKEESNRLVRYWKFEFPLLIRKYHRVILFMFVFFCVFFIVGFFSAKNDDGFTSRMLGDEYVQQTNENIDKGNPFGIYASGGSFLSWIGIMINNVRVSLVYFVQGLSFGILTLKSIMRESVTIGAFHEMFFARGLGIQWALSVLIHGTLELWSIIISGAAGLVLGMGLLFPGTKRRLDSLKMAAKDGVKMLVGIIPFFMVAAFFEGFLTRHYQHYFIFRGDWPLIILLGSLTMIIWYFVIYPVRLQQNLPVQENEEA